MRDGSATREDIDRTALELFAAKGIRETTIRDIAKAAGIAEGTMYRHYAGKNDLARHLFFENYTAIGRELKEIQAAEATTKDKLDAMVRHFCDAYERDRDVFTYLFQTRHSHMQNLTARNPNPYLVFRGVIRAGMRRGEIPMQDPDVATSMVLGVILQVIDPVSTELLNWGNFVGEDIFLEQLAVACRAAFETR